MLDTQVNPELLKAAMAAVARNATRKQAFVPATGGADAGMDPAMMGADPAMMGADPAMAGMDPAAMGMDPAMAGAGAPDVATIAQAVVEQLKQQGLVGDGAGTGTGAGAGKGAKPKVDVATEMYQIKKMLAKLVDAMGLPMGATEMMAPDEAEQQAVAEQPVGGEPGGEMGSAIQPIAPIQPAMPMPKQAKQYGAPYEGGGSSLNPGFGDAINRVDAIMAVRRCRYGGR